MTDKKEFYTVSEFAEIVGISRQAVYKKLNNQFKPFVNVIKGKKYLSHKALELFPHQKNDNQLSTKLSTCQPNCQPTVNQVEQPILNFLQEQITAKDKTILDLLDQLKQAQEQNNKLAELLKSEQDLNKANQILIAQAHENQKLLNQDEPKHKKKGFFSIFSKRENKE